MRNSVRDSSTTAPRRSPRWLRRPGPATLGVVMIVKNEAERLPLMFEDIAELADEVVVVDTGSTDATLDVCREWGVTLVQRPWRDDFSYARNQAIEHAAAAYLLWLDGDDRVPQDSVERLVRLRDHDLLTAPNTAYQMAVQNVDPAGRTIDSFLQVRIFPNRERIRYRGAIHESFMESLVAEGVRVEQLPIELLHSGYATPEVRRAKAERNARLLRVEVSRNPADIHARVHLAQALAGLGEFVQAVRHVDEVVGISERVGGHAAIRAELRVLRGGYRMAAGDIAGAVRDFDSARRLRPGWTVPKVLRAELHAGEGEWGRVSELLGPNGAGPDFSPGAFGAQVARLESTYWWLIGRSLLEAQAPEAALVPLRRALDREPTRADFRLDLAQVLLQLRRYTEAQALLEPLGDDDAALPRLFELLAALGLARAGTGELAGAGACLAPLVEFLGELLPDPEEATPAQLCTALHAIGQATAARNLAALDALVGASAG